MVWPELHPSIHKIIHKSGWDPPPQVSLKELIIRELKSCLKAGTAHWPQEHMTQRPGLLTDKSTRHPRIKSLGMDRYPMSIQWSSAT